MFNYVSALASHIDGPKGKFKASATDIEPEVEKDNKPEKEPTLKEKGNTMVDIMFNDGSDASCSNSDIDYDPSTDLDTASSGTKTGGIGFEADDAEETSKVMKPVMKPVSKMICGKATGKKSELVNITGDEPEATPKTKKKAMKQVTKANDRGDKMEVDAEEAPKAKKKRTKQVVREAINAHREEPAGKKQKQVSALSTRCYCLFHKT